MVRRQLQWWWAVETKVLSHPKVRNDFGKVFLKFLMLLAALTPALGCATEQSKPLEVASAKILIPRNQKVGSLKAGSLCFPRGSLKITDFVSGERDLINRMESILVDDDGREFTHHYPIGAKIHLYLIGLDSHLCAKSWGVFGLGDTKSLSGNIRAEFYWKIEYGNSTYQREDVINLVVEKSDAATPNELFGRIVQVLSNRILSDSFE